MISLKDRPSYVFDFFTNDYTNDYRPTTFIATKDVADNYLHRLGVDSHLTIEINFPYEDDTAYYTIGGSSEWGAAAYKEWTEKINRIKERQRIERELTYQSTETKLEYCSHKEKEVQEDNVMSLTYPPKHKWTCKDCGEVGYSFVEGFTKEG